jgi:AraC-like DNA-binding protein
MSEGHFCRIFKSITFKTPVDYLNYYRTTKAQDMLLNSNKKVLEVSMDVGFNNLSYFINIFKKNTGYTPSLFRKKFKNELFKNT